MFTDFLLVLAKTLLLKLSTVYMCMLNSLIAILLFSIHFVVVLILRLSRVLKGNKILCLRAPQEVERV